MFPYVRGNRSFLGDCRGISTTSAVSQTDTFIGIGSTGRIRGGIGERLLHLLARAKSPVWPIVTGLTFFVLYLTCAFGIVVWAHRAKIEPDPQGFPIEPTHPKPPDDSES